VKQLLNIAAILLILLTLSPMAMGAFSSCCSESHSCEQECSSEEEPKEDDCLSLCYCSCCGTASFYIGNKKEKATISFFEKIDIHSSFFYQPPFSPSVLIDIWQPPKI